MLKKFEKEEAFFMTAACRAALSIPCDVGSRFYGLGKIHGQKYFVLGIPKGSSAHPYLKGHRGQGEVTDMEALDFFIKLDIPAETGYWLVREEEYALIKASCHCLNVEEEDLEGWI